MKPILIMTVNAVKSLFSSKIDELKKDIEEIDNKIKEYKSIQIKSDFVTQKK